MSRSSNAILGSFSVVVLFSVFNNWPFWLWGMMVFAAVIVIAVWEEAVAADEWRKEQQQKDD